MNNDTEQLDADEITAALREGGLIAQRLGSYEPRQSQLELMELVVQTFNEDALAAAEAGTGVGKSFAYLLPAIHFALANEQRIVISTATITLQEQLFRKDIPFVADALGVKLKTVLMKGRGNYLCRRRMEDALREPDLEEASRDELERIIRWSENCKTGSRSELGFLPTDNLWERLCSESDNCPGMHCPERERCFVQLLRKEATAAHIIVANHHLLFADLVARKEGAGYENTVVLPSFTRLIIDEAHTIENAASSFFARDMSRIGILRQLGRLYRKKRANERGLLVRLSALLPPDVLIDPVIKAIEKARKAAGDLDKPALELCGLDGVFRFSPFRDNSGAEGSLFPLLVALRKKLLSITKEGAKLLEQVKSENQDNAIVWEIKSIFRRLDSMAELCAAFPEYKKKQTDVIWLERRQSGGKDAWANFSQTPLAVAENLKETLFTPNKTVVCVSATLTVDSHFDYWAARCGLNLLPDRTVLTGCFPSPFPYARAVLLASPVDAPLPEDSEYQNFINYAVQELAASSGGSALILFTSYKSLQSAYTSASSHLQDLGIRCLKQGDDDRSQLLQTFLADESSVLFATDSFWEGVDAPGDTLRLVILCRLPFKSPNDPVFEARCEILEKNGESPFRVLSLPEAVMKFKQGFGRLMRRSSDRGVVAVLDGRLIKKSYGAFFLRSLPETKTAFTEFKEIVRSMENFLFSAQ